MFVVDIISPEYGEVIQYLTTQTFPLHFTDKLKRRLILKSAPYTMIGDALYKQGKGGVLRHCIFQSEVSAILEGCHSDNCGGHFAGDSIARKALLSGYWWPTMILAQAPFEKWGIDFVGPIAPATRHGQKQYILVATEYVTKWAEAVATRTDNANDVARFLYENIITRFGCPKELVTDRGTHFLNATITALTDKYLIKHRKTSPYHPQANGQTEKTNGLLCKILTKTVSRLGTDWDTKLFSALWAYRTAYKVTTNSTPFQLVYGQEAVLPIELEVQSLRIAIDERLGDMESLTTRYAMMEKLDETRLVALHQTAVIQRRRKSYYDSKLRPKTFKPNDLVLMYDSRFQRFPSKLSIRWYGPYTVHEAFLNGSVQLEDFEGKQFTTRINGYRLKTYYT